MKHLLVLISISIFLGLGCEEIPPVINPNMGNNDPDDPIPVEDQRKQVLIEEFTGVRCVNCPAGSQAIEGLLDIHGQRLVAVSIHAGFFSPPYNSSNYDFRTDAGDDLLSYLGEPLGYPTAVVNRKKFEGEFDLQLGQSSWAGFIAADTIGEPQVKIDLNADYNDSDRSLKVTTTLYVQETISEDDIRLSLMVTESGIKDLQLTPAGQEDDYTHKHVLRSMITNFDGDPVLDAFTAGAEIEKQFNYTLPDEIVANKSSIIAILSLNGERKDVIQAHEVKLVE